VQTATHTRTCLFRITAADREKLQTVLFKRYPHREWGSFFRFGYRITNSGIHVSFVDSIEPQPGDLKRDSGIVEFSAGYILRAQLMLADMELGIGVIHSHPQGCSTYASSLDDDMDNLEASAAFRVTAAKLTNLKKRIDDYEAANPKPREGRAATKAASSTCPALGPQSQRRRDRGRISGNALIPDQRGESVLVFPRARRHEFADHAHLFFAGQVEFASSGLLNSGKGPKSRRNN
jgi:hypothetical protein